jgi:hypothetical protein
MAGELRNYDPERVILTWALAAGPIDLTLGLIDGPGAIVESKDAPAWSRSGDRQGNVIRNKMRNKSGFLTCTYKGESSLLATLSGIYIADQASQTSVGPMVLRDLNGSTLMTYLGAFIEDDPALGFGDTMSDRPYLFGFAQRVPFIAGSAAL